MTVYLIIAFVFGVVLLKTAAHFKPEWDALDDTETYENKHRIRVYLNWLQLIGVLFIFFAASLLALLSVTLIAEYLPTTIKYVE